jgi:type IV conjugative transfer system protein TraL
MQDEINRHIILKNLDNPPRMLFWDLDEFMLIAGPVVLGLFYSNFYIAASGFVVKKIYSKLIKGLPKGTVLHKIYWYFPSAFIEAIANVKNLPESFKRRLTL